MNLPKRRNVNQVRDDSIFNFVSTSRKPICSFNGSQEKATEPSRLQQYQVYNVIGKGAFGQVRLAKNTKNNQQYAIKMINKQLIKRHRAQDNMQQEIENQKILSNPNIVKFIDSFEDQEFVYIVLEYCPGGDLAQMLKQKKVLKVQEAFLYFYQMCVAVDYLHNMKIVHRDLKPENILVFNEKLIKLCDFNWSARLSDSQLLKPAFCGTAEYMAPEIMARTPQDLKIDIWGLGIILYQMLHGEVPFKDQQTIEQSKSILKNRSLVLDPKLPNGLAQLIRKLLAINPVNRPNTRIIFNNEWMVQMIQTNRLRNPYNDMKLSEPIFENKIAFPNRSQNQSQQYYMPNRSQNSINSSTQQAQSDSSPQAKQIRMAQPTQATNSNMSPNQLYGFSPNQQQFRPQLKTGQKTVWDRLKFVFGMEEDGRKCQSMPTSAR